MPAGYGGSRIESEGAGRGSRGSGQPYRADFGGRGVSSGGTALEFIRDYSRERPEVVAMWAFGIGFFLLGWKLKPS